MRGGFRSDLYYRLNVHRIHMPPLRERQGDLRLLVDHFVGKYGPTSGVERCGETAWTLLSEYSYPGNVRQLEHIIQRAVAIARGARTAARRSTRGSDRRAKPASRTREEYGCRRARARGSGNDRRNIGPQCRRDRRRRARAADQPHDDVALHEEVRDTESLLVSSFQLQFPVSSFQLPSFQFPVSNYQITYQPSVPRHASASDDMCDVSFSKHPVSHERNTESSPRSPGEVNGYQTHSLRTIAHAVQPERVRRGSCHHRAGFR